MKVGPRARRRLLLPLLATALLAASTARAFLLPLPSTPTPNPAPQAASTRSRLHAAADGASSSQREKKPLSWQESLELLISPTTSLAQRQVLLQVRVRERDAMAARHKHACMQGKLKWNANRRQ